eukprot:TRINITY_DN3870_c0_g2_i2.p1 TRINITY_DN3870_c0_g2~~TRINITY_DN3870_c0_g2_i2.p1  ORF type:complete len:122 (+),score=2.93 TRINITY_DN3870_c0_g2_i2:105-470(+)
MGQGSYQITKPNQTPNAGDNYSGVRLRVIRSVAKRERAQIDSQGPQIRTKCQRMWERPDSQEVGLEAATLQRKRNSSLVERARAENITGLKYGTEASGSAMSGSGAFSGRYKVYRKEGCWV